MFKDVILGRKGYEEFNHNGISLKRICTNGKWLRYSWIFHSYIDVLEEDIPTFEREYQRIKREEKLKRITDGI